MPWVLSTTTATATQQEELCWAVFTSIQPWVMHNAGRIIVMIETKMTWRVPNWERSLAHNEILRKGACFPLTRSLKSLCILKPGGKCHVRAHNNEVMHLFQLHYVERHGDFLSFFCPVSCFRAKQEIPLLGWWIILNSLQSVAYWFESSNVLLPDLSRCVSLSVSFFQRYKVILMTGTRGLSPGHSESEIRSVLPLSSSRQEGHGNFKRKTRSRISSRWSPSGYHQGSTVDEGILTMD